MCELQNSDSKRMTFISLACLQIPLRNGFPAFWEFLGIPKNSQLCKLAVTKKPWNSWEFLGMKDVSSV